MMRSAVLALVLFSLCSAAYSAPRIYEQDDLGDIIFDEFVYSISVDCNASTIKLIVMDESYERVDGAGTYLKYVDFSTPLISNMKTDGDGLALHSLPGDTTLMRGLFIMVIEKEGFRSKEIHFDIAPCYSNYTLPSWPTMKGPSENESETVENRTVPDVPYKAPLPFGKSPAPEEEEDEDPVPGVCPASFLLLLMFYKTMKP